MIFIDQGEEGVDKMFFFCRNGIFVWGGFLQEGGELPERGFALGGFWTEGGFTRGGILSEGGFCPEGDFVLFPLTTTVATPNINCILHVYSFLPYYLKG